MDAWNGIVELVDLDPKVAFGAERIEEASLDELESRLGAWKSRTNAMEGWHCLRTAARHVSELGMDEIRNRLADGRLHTDDALSTLEFVRSEPVWNRMRSEEPRLESIDGAQRAGKVEDFKNLDQQLQGLASQEVALRQFQSLPTGSAGQVGIVRGEVAKKTRHMWIRQLLDKAGEAVQAIKPSSL